MPQVRTRNSTLLTTSEISTYVGRSPDTLVKSHVDGQVQDSTRIEHTDSIDVRDLEASLTETIDFGSELIASDPIVDSIVNAAPPFSPNQRTRIYTLLSGSEIT
ncbi:hypothetical protein [Corynebacterium glutamicum]|uniref:hypothetical protein n=1 Tax=Corynebacterium glutamicum TaxID=1718 RepID=UPI0009435638|nr:hypothetical protein [Corynebacterium glutamicum]OKX81671.1 hypothetical protein AUO95_07765 [Corynebacterium glutamicum]